MKGSMHVWANYSPELIKLSQLYTGGYNDLFPKLPVDGVLNCLP